MKTSTTNPVPPPNKDETAPVPNSAEWLMFLGWLSIIAGAVTFAIAMGEKSVFAFAAAVSAFMSGVVMLGFRDVLHLLTRISNLLARLLHKPDPEKPPPPPPKPTPVKEEPYRL